MKIAIFTQPIHTNFGGTLQAFALQKTLVNLGHYPETINYRWSMDNRSSFRNFMALVRQIGTGSKLSYSFTSSEQRKIASKHLLFINKNINLSMPFFEKDKMINYFEKSKFDAVIVGSDQVWRPKYSPNIGAYFFDFLSENNRITKLSYAASFGTDNWEFSEHQQKDFKRLINKFEAVSVRESSAVKVCNDKFSVNAKHVLDPTLLLTVNDYISLIDINRTNNTGKIFNYVLDKSSDKIKLIAGVSEKLSLATFSTYPKHSRKDRFFVSKYDDYIYPEIESWIKSFYDAKFVVTDSFHGTVFSIIFNKNFLAISNEARGKARFESLLKLFGLEHRLISNFNELDSVDLFEDINYSEINEKVKLLRDDSLAFLKENLKSQS